MKVSKVRCCRGRLVVNTFWDLGRNDLNTIWLHQAIGGYHRFVGYYENSGEFIGHYVRWLKDWAAERDITFGDHYWPHDGDRWRFGFAQRLVVRFLLCAGLLSGFAARLGLRQQEEGDAQQRDGHPDARRRDHNRNGSNLDQRRNTVAARHLLEEIGREPFVHHSSARHSVKPLGHPSAGGQGEARNQGHRPDGLELRAEAEAPDAYWIGDDDDGQQEQ
jgi:hypothetical protein